MDMSKLNSNERLAFWGAIASIVGTILIIVGGYGAIAGGLWLTFLLAIAMIVILFLPQWSPQTNLPGSKGSLMLIVGGVAGIGAILGLLTLFTWIGFLGTDFLLIIGLLVGIVGGLMMGWGGWQEFQAEGGKFQLGTTPSGTAAPPPATPPPSETPPADRAAEPPVERPAEPPVERTADTDMPEREDRPPNP